jgi:hypothetical protein
MAQYYQQAGTWPIGTGSDPYFPYTTLLLHGDGTNGAQNNTFLDGSTNNFTITRNGNTTQGSFSPYVGPGNWSNYFDGTGDYLTVPASAAYAFGTGDFTVEAWVYQTARNATYGSQIAGPHAYTVGADWLFIINTAGNLYFQIGNSSSGAQTSTSTVPLNTWSHVVVVRLSGTVTFYINGVAAGSGSYTTSIANTQALGIGAANNGNAATTLTGYISNLRIVKGTAIYTSAFTPLTTPLIATTQTVLLTCNNNGFIDQSAANNTLTRNGDTQVSKFSPFTLYQTTPASYSGYFDGTGDYLTAPASNSTIWPGSGSFTIEYWLYLPANPSAGYYTHFSYGTSGSVLRVFNTAAVSKIEVFSGTSVILNPAWPTAGQWNHFALVRNGTTLTLYINGAVAQSVTNSTDFSTGTLTIGNESASTLLGSISNFRIVKGTAVYTSAFTPPTSPLTAISGTSLLTCQSTTFIDNSTNAFTITASGNATPKRANPFTDTVTGPTPYSTTTYGGSGYFDGTGDYLGVASNAAFAFGTGDFTIECWFLTTSSGVYQRFWWFGDDNDNTNISTGNAVQFGGASQTAITGSTIYTNNWYHLAYVRSSGSGKLYLNGAQVGSTTANSYNSSARTFYIGATGAGANPFFGYISNLRIVKGTAVYTGPFVPPAAPVTAVTNTQLLLNGTNAGIFDNTTVNDIETVGSAQVNTTIVKYGTGSISFNGTTDYIISAPRSNVNNAFGTGNFTVELWVYATAFANYKSIYGNSNGITATGWHCGLNSTGKIFIYSNSAFKVTSTNSLTLNAWNHVAIVRNGSTVTIYIDGVAGGTWTLTTETFTDGYCFFGVTPGFASEFFSGYMDDIRITRGYARYTANFTPPTAAFPNF